MSSINITQAITQARSASDGMPDPSLALRACKAAGAEGRNLENYPLAAEPPDT
jgi:hypothetical protein